MCCALSQRAEKGMRQSSSTKTDIKNCPAEQACVLSENIDACLFAGPTVTGTYGFSLQLL